MEQSGQLGFGECTGRGDPGGDHLAFAKSVDTDIWDFNVVDTDGDGTPDTLRVSAAPDRK